MWRVDYSDTALRDLQVIYDYISGILLESEIAKKQIDRITDAADSLDNMPLRCRLYDEEPWHSKGLRVLTVDNYLIFYLPDESKHIVSVIRIMYGGRDISKHLDSSEQQHMRRD